MQRANFFSTGRISFLKVCFSFAALAIFLRLAQIQIFFHDYFLALAEQQHWAKVVIPAARGEILTDDGFSLAANEEAYLVYAVPQEVENAPETAEKLVEAFLVCARPEGENAEDAGWQAQFLNTMFLGGEKENMEGKEDVKEKVIESIEVSIKNTDLFWVPIAHRISLKQREEIEKLNLSGVHFESEQKRSYPEGSLAAHILGFVGKNEEGKDQGYFGLEGFYDGDLSGVQGFVSREQDAEGKPIPVGGFKEVPPQDGRWLVLTINRELQYMLEKNLKAGVERYGADSGTVILMEPQTGAILAMANYPNYSPESWEENLQETDISKIESYKNLAISENYEPGSVLKVLTMSAALETGVVTPKTTYEDEGAVEIGGYKIRTWDNKYHGTIDMAQILQLSNNTGACWVGRQLGLENYWEFLKKFALGEKTGVDLEGEDKGIVKEKGEWREIDLVTASFGQGIAVTPIQLASIFATIANNGIRVKPYLVKEIRDGERIIEMASQESRSVISAKTARIMKDMLKSVIEKGEFRWFIKHAGLEKYDFAGKTGTAQVPEGGRYTNKTQVTFVGFAPTYQTKFVLLVKLANPKSSTYSAETAVPLWLEMAKELFVYFGIAPK